MFTVAPWGYRVLTGWVVHALPVRNVTRAFRFVTDAALIAAGALAYLFFQRLGFGVAASLLGAAAFGLSPPVVETLRYRFLAEPLTVALELALLAALQSGAGLAALALIATLGALAKDSFLLLLPAVYFALRGSQGHRRALVACAAVAAPAALATALLRWWWTPHLAALRPALGPELVTAALARLRDTWSDTWPAPLLGGLGPLALLGALRAEARPYLARHGYVLAMTMVTPFVAWLNVPAVAPVPIFGRNVTRLLIFALPVVIPLALLALGRLWPALGPAPPAMTPPRRRPPATAAALAVLLAALALPVFALDRYRRVDLRGPRDGPLVLAVCRESLRTASRLDRGLEVRFDPEANQFVWGESDPGQLSRMRWFLRDGWGPQAHYGIDEIRMRGETARLLLPLLTPRPVEAALTLLAARAGSIGFDVNGVSLGERPVSAEPQEVSLRIRAESLFRGDNVLSLRTATPGVKLLALRYRALP
ncbi:MAG TPA: hypothetical protein VGQ78_10600 [Vicinamibacteria bacterium]|nr:hypothetical protein [Vicinamibacteria bacterium]